MRNGGSLSLGGSSPLVLSNPSDCALEKKNWQWSSRKVSAAQARAQTRKNKAKPTSFQLPSGWSLDISLFFLDFFLLFTSSSFYLLLFVCWGKFNCLWRSATFSPWFSENFLILVWRWHFTLVESEKVSILVCSAWQIFEIHFFPPTKQIFFLCLICSFTFM